MMVSRAKVKKLTETHTCIATSSTVNLTSHPELWTYFPALVVYKTNSCYKDIIKIYIAVQK
jgi:hypothetical protein